MFGKITTYLFFSEFRLNTFFLKLLFFALYSFSLPPKHFLIIFSGKLATKNSQKISRKEEKFFFFYIIYFTFFLSPYGIKQNHLLFSLFLSPEIGKPQGKTSFKKIFFFFFFFGIFFTLPLLVIGKITTYLFFRNFDLKCPKMPLSAQVSFFTNYLFSAVITRTHHLPTHTPFFRPIMCKKRALHLFLKITFFCSLLLLLTPETLPNHLFRQSKHQK